MINKRNPKKTTNKKKSNGKKRPSDYFEETKDEFIDMEQSHKFQKVGEEDEFEELQSNFKIKLDNVDQLGLRRSTRRSVPVIDSGKLLWYKLTYLGNVSESLDQPNKLTLKRNSKRIIKDSDNEEYIPTHSRNTRAKTKGKSTKPNYKADDDLSCLGDDDY